MIRLAMISLQHFETGTHINCEQLLIEGIHISFKEQINLFFKLFKLLLFITFQFLYILQKCHYNEKASLFTLWLVLDDDDDSQKPIRHTNKKRSKGHTCGLSFEKKEREKHFIESTR